MERGGGGKGERGRYLETDEGRGGGSDGCCSTFSTYCSAATQ